MRGDLMEKSINKNPFSNFSLENHYFTDQSIVVAAINYFRSLKKDCKFLGFDSNSNPILSINDFNYKLLYKRSFLGLISFDSIQINKISNDTKIINNELSEIILDNLNEYFE